MAMSDALVLISIVLGATWASGVNLYLTVASLGIMGKMGWVALPGDLTILSNPFIIAIAVVLYLIEFFADKVPYVDSVWDGIHTLIRPAGGALIGYLALSQGEAFAQMAGALVGGAVSFDSHLTKASTRAFINMSPEPFSNSVASVTEDVTVMGVLWLIVKHPIVVGCLVIAFVAFSFWIIPKLFRFIAKIFRFIFRLDKEKPTRTSA